jgi:8-oxo-dGTP pyrophosphatase MutT (NUDIX family)
MPSTAWTVRCTRSAVSARPPSFDPRTIPVVDVGIDLPPVDLHTLSPQALRDRFLSPPTWEPEIRREPRFIDQPPRQAAVLIPLVMRPEPTLLLTQRPAHMRTHSGQIAFPGGKVDEDDHGPVATALREAHEEVGLEPEFVEVLGSLPVYFTGSSFYVTPVVGLVRPGFSLLPNPQEVADVFEVPLSYVMNPAHHRRHVVDWDGVERQWFSMPYLQGESERFIWGATAGMLRNLYRFLSA